MRSGDVVVADRGFCSYVHLAMLQSSNSCSLSPASADVRMPFGITLQQRSRVRNRGSRRESGLKAKHAWRDLKLLGEQVWLVTWSKVQKQTRLDQRQTDFEALPATLHRCVTAVYRVNDQRLPHSPDYAGRPRCLIRSDTPRVNSAGSSPSAGQRARGPARA